MSWLAILGLGKAILRPFRAAMNWLLDHPTFAVTLLLIANISVHQFVIDPRLRDRADKWQQASEKWEENALKWQAAHGRVIEQVAEGRRQAAERDRQNAARVEREQARIIERTAHDYQDLLADRDAALERLRRDLVLARTADDNGGGGPATVPGDLAARCRAFGAADCDALLAALPDFLSEAEANTAKLISLQDYVRGLLGIDFNGDLQ